MKTAKLLLALLLAAGVSSVASAHSYPGTLGAATTATDKWYFICQNPNTATVQFQIKRTTVGTTVPCVRVIYDATGANATSCGALAPATPIVIATGAGAKFFTVNKNPIKSGALNYTVSAHCIDGTGVHNPDDQTAPQVYQLNQ